MRIPQFRCKDRNEDEWSEWIDHFAEDGQEQQQFPDDDEILEYEHRMVERDHKQGDMIVEGDLGRTTVTEPTAVPFRLGVGGPKIGEATVHPDGTFTATVTDEKVAEQLRGANPLHHGFSMPTSCLGYSEYASTVLNPPLPHVGGGSEVRVTDGFKRGARADTADETIVVDAETGGQKGEKQEAYALVPVWPQAEIARTYGMGKIKHGADNWRKGYSWSLSISSLLGHINSWRFGETWDKESGLHHLAHAAFHLNSLMEFQRLGLGTDDRGDLSKKDGR